MKKNTGTLFTEASICKIGEFEKINCDRQDLVYAPLWWHKKGLNQTASGYGAKLTSPYKIKFENKLYRIYTTIYSNNGTSWFTIKGRKIVVG